MKTRACQWAATLFATIALFIGATFLPEAAPDGAAMLLAAPLLFATPFDELRAHLAATFADPSSDLISSIQELSPENIQYVVDSINPFERLAPGGLLGDELFPERRTEELTFRYLKGANGAAVMAQVTSHNSEAPLVTRRGVEVVSGEIPAIKQKRHQDANTLIRLQSADQMLRSQAVREIFDDTTNARLGIAARVEKLRMDALATGIATQTSEEGLVYSVDYGVPSSHKATLLTTARWSEPTSTPLADLEAWQNTMVAETGQQMATAVASTAIVNALRKHESIRRAIHGVNYDRRLTMDEINAFLREQDLPTFVTYDTIVQQESLAGVRTSTRLWPQNRLTLLPALAGDGVGRTHRAPTAEEAVRNLAEGTIVVDGFRIAIHVYVATNDPKGVVTLGVASTFPSFERADHVFQAQVL